LGHARNFSGVANQQAESGRFAEQRFFKALGGMHID
jgi:hypothetical protein